MKKRKTYTKEFKGKIVNEYINNNVSINDIMKKYNIENYSIIYNWIKKHGEKTESKVLKSKNKSYSFKFKLNVVEYYLDTRESHINIANKFNVKNRSIVARWCNDALNKSIFELLPKEKGRKSMKKKNKSNISKEEKYKLLEEENELLRIENAFLKKKNQLIEEKELREKKK